MAKIQIKRNVAPAGLHNAVLGGVFDVGLQPGFKDQPARRQHVYFFELESEFGAEYERRRMPCRLSDSLHPMSRLSSLVEALKGSLSDEEMAANEFDPETLVGKPCTVQIEHYEAEDGTPRARIANVFPHDPHNSVMKAEFVKSAIPDWVLQLREQALSD